MFVVIKSVGFPVKIDFYWKKKKNGEECISFNRVKFKNFNLFISIKNDILYYKNINISCQIF